MLFSSDKKVKNALTANRKDDRREQGAHVILMNGNNLQEHRSLLRQTIMEKSKRQKDASYKCRYLEQLAKPFNSMQPPSQDQKKGNKII